MSRKRRRNRENAPQPPQEPVKPKIKVFPLDVFRAQDAAAKISLRAATVDGYDNFLNRIGLNNDNTLSAGTYEFNLVTRNRVLLEAAYRGSWIVGTVIDSIAEDMTRAGVSITTSEAEDRLEKFHTAFTRLQIWQSLNSNIKWGRLYGGACGVLQIDGQNLATPLNLKTVGKGQFKGIAVYDRWQLNPVMTPVIQSGPELGLPQFYQITTSLTSSDPDAKTATGQVKVHHSRVIRYTGIDLPYFQAITEMLWGESVLERLWDRLIAFDNATMSTGQLIDRAYLRTIGVDGLRQIIAAGGEALAGLESMFDMMRRLQVNEGLTLIDKEDVSETTSYTFSGLSDVLLQFAQQLSGASGIPLVRLFGQAPSGIGATGDVELRTYYDNINAQQEAKLRNPLKTLIQIMWQSEFGEAQPEDLEFSFTPLWQTSALDKATIGKTNTDTIIAAHDGGLVPTEAAMKDLRGLSAETGLFGNITDEDIAEAELEPPPMPDAPEEEPEEPSIPDLKLVKDSAWKRLARLFRDEKGFKESEHPRKSDGEFGKGGSGGGSKVHEKDKDAAVNFLAGHIKDKDWDAFSDEIDKRLDQAITKKVSPEEAAKFKRSHNFTFESDPDNEGMHRGKGRGKEVEDPAIVISFGGEQYVLDGQHRLNKAVKEKRPVNVAIIEGDFLKKFGITEKTFEGKKAYDHARKNDKG